MEYSHLNFIIKNHQLLNLMYQLKKKFIFFFLFFNQFYQNNKYMTIVSRIKSYKNYIFIHFPNIQFFLLTSPV